jgi:chorismate synthase
MTSIEIKGRHDPCLCPRIVPVIEAMAALVVADCLLMQKTIKL